MMEIRAKCRRLKQVGISLRLGECRLPAADDLTEAG